MIKKYYSCKELAELKLPGKPTTRQGWDAIVNNEDWSHIEVTSRGRLGKTREYQPSDEVMTLIEYLHNEQTDPIASKVDQSHFVYDANIKEEDDQVVYVNRYLEVNATTGSGSGAGNEWLIERVAFNVEALRQSIGVPAKYLKIANVDGYSMEPFLFHGDQVFIDTRCNTFKNDGVYAIIYDGDLRFKRVRVNYADRTVLLKSDNDGGMGPELLNEEQAKRLKILGKVIHFKFSHFKL